MPPIVPTDFTPWASLAGGILIGLSAVFVMAALGRITGILGITAGTVAGPDRDWRVAFIGGLLAAPLLWALVAGGFPAQVVSGDLPWMAVSGLLVGIGTSLGSGCTSGHGVCGLARLSGRSLAAVATFMAFAALTVYVLRHAGGA
ncbi:YeeE/YedE thiosulfate transporter family protein [uncultured Jannaschia sp.]|uniref:YeeE/YedE family protein n=1 Tax=uncultured Jannaschia sp. TaxID=293347 RepID=UPI00262A00F4|nr:YeeE/YedE thiosulfate transporter family protein [uncultured Jannaschia sp.]